MSELLNYRSRPTTQDRPRAGGVGRVSFAFSVVAFTLLAIGFGVIVMTERNDSVRDRALGLAVSCAGVCSLVAVVLAAVGIWEGNRSRRWAAASLAATLLNGATLMTLFALMG